MPLIGQTVTVKPAREGLKIPNPQGSYKPLSDSGSQVQWSRYFDQMWRAGDVLADGEAYKRKAEAKVKGGGRVRAGKPAAERAQRRTARMKTDDEGGQ